MSKHLMEYQQKTIDTKDKELKSLRLAVVNLTDNQSDHLRLIDKLLEAVEFYSSDSVVFTAGLEISELIDYSAEGGTVAREVLNSPLVKQYKENKK